MAWYWWTAICIYLSIGMWLGGMWFNDDGDTVLHFIYSITIIGLFWPLAILVVLFVDFKQEIGDFTRINKLIFKYKEYKREKMNDEEYDNMRLERIGADEEYWKV